MKNVFMKMATSASAVAVSAMLSMTPVFAASSVTVDDTYYEAPQTFDTWTWDGADAMTLTNFNGNYISADGDLIITISGTNTVSSGDEWAGIVVNDGNLTIESKEDGASLKADGDYAGIAAEKDLTINKAKVEASGKRMGLYAGNVTIKDSDVTAKADGTW